MILYTNVCDFCKEHREVKQNDSQFLIKFRTTPLSKSVNNTAVLIFEQENELTFCKKECMIKYLEDFMEPNGELVKNV